MATSLGPNRVKGSIKNRWNPKVWRPEYDRIVAYSVLGRSNVWIGRQLGFTKEYVSVILHLPQAQELYMKLRNATRERMEQSIPEMLQYVAKRTGDRLKQMIDDEDLFKASPFAVIDRGMDVLKGLQHLKGGGNGAPGQFIENNIGQITVLNSQKSDIMEGLTKIAEIARNDDNGTK